MRLRKSAAVLALAALSLAQAAEAKKKATECITETELVSLLRYAMPSVIEGVALTCRPHLSDAGFLATSSETMIARFSEGRDDAWPAARTAFVKLGGAKADKELMDGLSDEVLQPLAAEAIAGVMLEEVKPEKCGKAEHVLQAMDKIAPTDLTDFLGALLTLVIGPKDKDMPVCET